MINFAGQFAGQKIILTKMNGFQKNKMGIIES